MAAYSRWALIRGWALIRINTVIVANFSAIRVHHAVVFRSTISRSEVKNALFKDTDREGSNKCSIMVFVEKKCC